MSPSERTHSAIEVAGGTLQSVIASGFAVLHGKVQSAELHDARVILDVLPVALYMTDAEGRLTYFNQAAALMSGRTPELGSDKWCVTWKLFCADGSPMPHDKCPMAVALKERRAVRGDLAIAERPDGTRFWFEPYPTPLFDKNGTLIGGINMLLDVTERRRAAEELRRNERELRDFVENGNVAMHWVGPDGVILWANHTELDMLGYDEAEYVGHHIAQFHVDEPVIADILERLGNRESLRDYPARLRCKDGSIRQVLINSSVLWDDDSFVHTRCFTRDITERLESNEALRESERRFRTLFESMDEGYCVIEMKFDDDQPVDFRFLEVNPAFETQTGIKDASGKRVRELVSDVEQRWFDLYGQVAKTGETIRFENPVASLGRCFDVCAFRVGPPELRRVGVIFNDITHRKSSEQALRRSAETFAALVEQSPLGIYTVDADFRIANVSAGAMPAFRNVSPLIGRDFEEVMHTLWPEPFASEAIRIFRHTLETGEPYVSPGLTEMRKDLGAIESYEWQVNRVILADGRPGVVCYFFDATRIQHANQELRAAKEEAEAANRSKDNFLATLSHELRTPLTAIVGWMSILKPTVERYNDATLKEGFAVIERNTSAQQQLIADVLDVSRIISGKLRLEIGDCDLADVVNAALQSVKHAARAKGITITASLDPSFCQFACDPDRIQQVIWNLLSNAIKFTPRNGTISVSLEQRESNARIEITDNGMGIAPEFLPLVFNRFAQADGSTRRKFGGLGLGLSIVKQIVEMHGGTVKVASDGKNQGATFTVELPINAVQLQHDSVSDDGTSAAEIVNPSSAAREPDEPTKAPRLDDLHVLVVDDDSDSRHILCKLLTNVGASVSDTPSASEALALISQMQRSRTMPHVLVSDIAMPDDDGYDLIRALRSSGISASQLPAIAVTAYADKRHERAALAAGFQNHLAKPLDPQDFILTVASLAGRTN